MKKLISAAASLAMAASMVSTAVPFATGAADASKTFSLRAFDGKTAYTSEEAAAGFVVPVGFYIGEDSSSTGMNAQFTVNSKDGDASKVKFTEELKEWNGELIEMFAGKLIDGRTGKSFQRAQGNMPISVAESSESSKADPNYTAGNAYCGFAYTSPNEGYEWYGEKSDDYPVFVVGLNFPAGTPDGTYTVDFLDYITNVENRSSQGAGGGQIYNTANNNLNLESLTITIGDAAPAETTASTPAATTAAPDATTTAAPTTEAPSETTTTPSGSGSGSTDLPEVDNTGKQADYIIKPKKVETTMDDIKAGNCNYAGEPNVIELEIYVDQGDHLNAGHYIEFLDSSLPDGFKVKGFDPNIYAAGDGNTYFWGIQGDTIGGVIIDAQGHPQSLNEDQPTIIFQVEVDPDVVKDGTYTYTLDRYHVVEDGYNALEFDAAQELGIIQIGDAETPVETTAPAETTTEAPATETTAAPSTETTASATAGATTTAAPAETTAAPTTAAPSTDEPTGTPLYGDSNCDGKVNIADVVVLNKWLNDNDAYNLTAQGKLNADCSDPKDGTEITLDDSDAIIKSIVHLVTLPVTK